MLKVEKESTLMVSKLKPLVPVQTYSTLQHKKTCSGCIGSEKHIVPCDCSLEVAQSKHFIHEELPGHKDISFCLLVVMKIIIPPSTVAVMTLDCLNSRY